MIKSNKSEKRPTWVHLVEAAMAKADDFISLPQIRKLTGANTGQATAALHHLSKMRAAENVKGIDGVLWWFLTPASDLRCRKVEERIPEEKNRRQRRSRVTKPKQELAE